VVGDTGPGGGTVFYVDETAGDGSRYMEAVVAGTTPAWDDTNGGSYYQWCVGTGQTNNVTTGTAIGSGTTNTDNMVAACTSGAANSVRAYTGGGLLAGSWSLPSLDELNALDALDANFFESGGLFPVALYQDLPVFADLYALTQKGLHRYAGFSKGVQVHPRL